MTECVTITYYRRSTNSMLIVEEMLGPNEQTPYLDGWTVWSWTVQT